MEAVLARRDLSLSHALILASFNCETWKLRTVGERDYLENLISWTRGDPVFEADRLWHGQLIVTNEDMSWTRTILSLNFRRMRRGNIPFYRHTVRFERKMRSDMGYFLAYQMAEAGNFLGIITQSTNKSSRGGANSWSAKGFGQTSVPF